MHRLQAAWEHIYKANIPSPIPSPKHAPLDFNVWDQVDNKSKVKRYKI